jgi:hypothetical protein
MQIQSLWLIIGVMYMSIVQAYIESKLWKFALLYVGDEMLTEHLI